jgi:prepilin-type N-terminal cleavage/methylation domain-containing protein
MQPMTRTPISMPLRNREGFTLVEVMIAVFVLTVALLGLISVTIMIIKGNDFSKRMTTATTLAKDKIEEVKKRPYNTVSPGTTTDYRNVDSSAGSTGAYFTRIMTVTDNAPATNMKTVQVEVRWTWGGTRTVTVRTIIGA